MRITNRHGRTIHRSASEVFADLETIGTDDDRVWPAPSMPFVRTPGPLRVGVTEEHHGIIHALLDELCLDQVIIWKVDQPFLHGTHGFRIEETQGGCYVTHTLEATLAWWFVPVWLLRVRSIHDRIVERLLDRLAVRRKNSSSRQFSSSASANLA